MKKKKLNIKILAITAFISFIADLISKEIISSSMYLRESIPVFDQVLKITYIKNNGIAFGLFQDFPNILLVISIIVVIVIFYLIKSLANQNVQTHLAFGLILGGAFGNILDRIRFQSVRDFIDVGINYKLRWPIFNIADSVVLIGVIMLLIYYDKTRDTEGL